MPSSLELSFRSIFLIPRVRNINRSSFPELVKSTLSVSDAGCNQGLFKFCDELGDIFAVLLNNHFKNRADGFKNEISYSEQINEVIEKINCMKVETRAARYWKKLILRFF